MLFSEMRTRFAKFMGTEDTVQPAISDTDRDSLLNEALLEYLARFGTVSRYTATVNAAGNSNNFVIGVANDDQWVECLSMTRVGRPLERLTFDRATMTEEGEQQSTTPDRYALALVSRTIGGASQFKCVVAPRGSGVLGYAARFRPFAAELAAVGDIPEADDEQVDQAVRIAALRAGALLNYGPVWMQQVAAPLPELVRREMQIDRMMIPHATPLDPQVPA